METSFSSTNQTLAVQNLSKKFCRNFRRAMMYGLRDIAQSCAGIPPATHRLRKGEFPAIDNLTFSLNTGDILGIIGPNGSGKTTLLRCIASILAPDNGTISLAGKVAPLFTIQAGFHPYLSVKENLFYCGAMLGMSQQEVCTQRHKILTFAEMEELVDAPASSLSWGMSVRATLALALHAHPDILLIDEVLSHTDQHFREKSIQAIQGFSRKASVIVVSHNLEIIQTLCTRILVLVQGSKVFESTTVSEGVEFFRSLKNMRK
jgi:lipopolysaccharide transport system ATP-binding protein